jgi:hypothetical protein
MGKTRRHRLRTLDDAVSAALEQYEAAKHDPELEHVWRRVLAGLNVAIGAVLELERRGHD